MHFWFQRRPGTSPCDRCFVHGVFLGFVIDASPKGTSCRAALVLPALLVLCPHLYEVTTPAGATVRCGQRAVPLECPGQGQHKVIIPRALSHLQRQSPGFVPVWASRTAAFLAQMRFAVSEEDSITLQKQSCLLECSFRQPEAQNLI